MSTRTSHLRKRKRSFQKQKAEKPYLSVYFTKHTKLSFSFCLFPARTCHPKVTVVLIDESGRQLLLVLSAPLPRWCEHRRSMTHTHGKGKLKQGENVLLCHIPAVSNSSGEGGCTMDTLYLAQDSSPTQVNPTVAACRTWHDRANRTNCLGNNCPGGPRGAGGLKYLGRTLG